MRSLLVFSLALIATPSVAGAQSSSPSQPSTTSRKAAKTLTKDPNRMDCRTTDVTGSRLGGKRVCRTVSQWAEIEAANRSFLQRAQANPYSTRGGQ